MIGGLLKERFLRRNMLIGGLLIVLLFTFSTIYISSKLKMYHSKEITRYANIIGSVNENFNRGEEIVPYILDSTLNDEYIEKGLEYL